MNWLIGERISAGISVGIILGEITYYRKTKERREEFLLSLDETRPDQTW